MKQPRAKKGGISLPVHLWRAVDDLCAMRTEAYEQMGGKTKQAPSDELEIAVEVYLAKVQKDYGPFPVTEAERRVYVEKLKKAMEKDAIADLRGVAKAS